MPLSTNTACSSSDYDQLTIEIGRREVFYEYNEAQMLRPLLPHLQEDGLSENAHGLHSLAGCAIPTTSPSANPYVREE